MSVVMFDRISRDIIKKFQWPMDGLDRFSNRPCVYRIAKELHIHPQVVRNRLSELFDSGFINAIKFYANDRFMPWVRYHILMNQSKEITVAVVNDFESLPFVERVIVGTLRSKVYGDSGKIEVTEKDFGIVSVIAFNDDDLKRKMKLLPNCMKQDENIIEIMKSTTRKSDSISRLELSIVNGLLRQDPLKANLTKLSEDLSIPLRTLRRKVDNLIHNGVIYQEVSFNADKATGVLIVYIIMLSQYERYLPRIFQDKFLENRMLLYKNLSKFSFFIMHAANFAEVDEIEEGFRKINPHHWVAYRGGSYNNPYIEYGSSQGDT
jgi:DNA-binding Lrp family transcriptional regulator